MFGKSALGLILGTLVMTSMPHHATAEDGSEVLLVLLGGQSNMDGVGRVADLSGEWAGPFPAVPLWKQGWKAVAPGLEATSSDCFGPEVSLSRALHAAWPGRDLRFIKHAASGQTLAQQWAAGNGPRYREFKAKLDSARADLNRQGQEYRFVGMLWMQGESDAMNASFASAYQVNLERLVATIRNEVRTPDLPFIMGRIAKHYDSKPPGGNATVRATQEAVAEADPNVACFDTDDIEIASYNPGHYNSEGQLELGRRFATVLLRRVDLDQSAP